MTMEMYGLADLETMIQIVRHSTSVNNAFISTVDHLPCDIIRSIWFIQSCNLAISDYQNRVRALGIKIKEGRMNGDDDLVSEAVAQYVEYRSILERNEREARLESEALLNQLVNHSQQLEGELSQLRTVMQVLKDLNRTYADQLKAQLVEHYTKHPLQLQKDALKAEAEAQAAAAAAAAATLSILAPKGSNSKSKSKSSKNSHLKLILKLPKNKRGRPRKYPVEDSVGTSKPKIKIHLKPLKPKKEDGDKGRTDIKITKKQKKQLDLEQKRAEELAATGAAEALIAGEEVDNNLYCFCKQPSFGDMIGCDNEESCPNGDWFHYKCVGLLNRVEAMKYVTGKEKWYCSEGCRKAVEGKPKGKANKQKK